MGDGCYSDLVDCQCRQWGSELHVLFQMIPIFPEYWCPRILCEGARNKGIVCGLEIDFRGG